MVQMLTVHHLKGRWAVGRRQGLSSGRSQGGAGAGFSSDEVLNQQLNHRPIILRFSVLYLPISLKKCLT